MHALVVYESLWGNTEQLARAIADALAPLGSVEVFDSDTAPSTTHGYDILIVGGPTHAFGMTRAKTRAFAVQSHSAPRAPEQGLREWLRTLQRPETTLPVMVFDTRVDTPRLPGSAAKAARRALRKLGFDTTTLHETFRVRGYEGPLLDGETARAVAWATEAATRLGADTSPTAR